MTEELENREKRYPVVPDYDTLTFGRDAPGVRGEQQAVSGGRPPRGRRDIVVLSAVAAALLLLIAVWLGLIMTGALVRRNGKMGFGFGGQSGSDPFRLAVESEPVVPDSSLDIDIHDPPAVETSPVKSAGLMTAGEIADRLSPSVVAVLNNGLTGSSAASGVILTENGFIVTTAEAVRWSDGLIVVLPDGRRRAAALVGMDAGTDIAVLKVEESGLKSAVFGNSNVVRTGDAVVAVGVPYEMGLTPMASSGIVSAVRRNVVRGDRTLSVIQTDARLTAEFAGAPLVNVYGQVVGIVSSAVSEGASFGGAVPMNTAKTVIEALVAAASGAGTGSTETGGTANLGLNAFFMGERMAAANGLPVGLFVTGVPAGSGAEKAGLRAGDVITGMDGVRLTDILVYTRLAAKHAAGDTALLRVYRDENRYDDREGTYFETEIVMAGAGGAAAP